MRRRRRLRRDCSCWPGTATAPPTPPGSSFPKGTAPPPRRKPRRSRRAPAKESVPNSRETQRLRRARAHTHIHTDQPRSGMGRPLWARSRAAGPGGVRELAGRHLAQIGRARTHAATPGRRRSDSSRLGCRCWPGTAPAPWIPPGSSSPPGTPPPARRVRRSSRRAPESRKSPPSEFRLIEGVGEET